MRGTNGPRFRVNRGPGGANLAEMVLVVNNRPPSGTAEGVDPGREPEPPGWRGELRRNWRPRTHSGARDEALGFREPGPDREHQPMQIVAGQITVAEFDSMINLRPGQGNRSRSVDDPATRSAIEALVVHVVVP